MLSTNFTFTSNPHTGRGFLNFWLTWFIKQTIVTSPSHGLKHKLIIWYKYVSVSLISAHQTFHQSDRIFHFRNFLWAYCLHSHRDFTLQTPKHLLFIYTGDLNQMSYIHFKPFREEGKKKKKQKTNG